MLKKLFTYLLFGLTCANVTFGMEKHNSNYLPELVELKKSIKSKHSLATLFKKDTAAPGIINRYGTAAPLKSTRYVPVLKDFKKDSKAYNPDAYDNALEWPLNEPISLKTRARNFVRDEVTASAAGKLAARMAAIGLMQFSSTLVHEYGHALVGHYLQNGTAHIFIGPNENTLRHAMSKLNANHNKFPKFSIVSFNPSIAFTAFAFDQDYKNIPYKPLQSLAGPVAGALFDLAIIKALKSVNANSDKHTNCFLNLLINSTVTPVNALLLKTLICKNPLESQAEANLFQNICNILPRSINSDGYSFLRECGIQETTLNGAVAILDPAINLFFTIAPIIESVGKYFKYLHKTIDPKLYKETFINSDNKECSDIEAYFKIFRDQKSKSEHTLTKIANTSK